MSEQIKHPLVSVLMTAYNREDYIAEAIESVLKSTYKNFELIIVDDCSVDKTVEIAKKYQSKDTRIFVYVNEKNLGDYNNRNKAAEYAKGKYLKYLDSDDLLYSFGLELFVQSMETFPDVALGLSSRIVQQETIFPIYISPEEAYHRHFFKSGFLDCGPTGTIIRTDIFKSIGGFSGKRMIGDFELWLKIAKKYPVIIIAPSLIFWRIHDGQEFVEGHKNGIYLEMNLNVITEALLSPDCSLNDKQKTNIINYYKKASAKELLKLIKKGEIKNARFLQSKLKLKFADYITSIIFKNELNSFN